MPHCPRSLYERLLRDNWSSDDLSKIILIGNRLGQYPERWRGLSLFPTRTSPPLIFVFTANCAKTLEHLVRVYGKQVRLVSPAGSSHPTLSHDSAHTAPHFQTIPLPDCDVNQQAFNDLAIQWFSLDDRDSLSNTFWHLEDPLADELASLSLKSTC
jgi:hypothetical protein